MTFNPIPTNQGRNQPLYERHVTKSGRNRVKIFALPQGISELRRESSKGHASFSENLVFDKKKIILKTLHR